MTDTFLMIGLPETGKTTYLAALWHVVSAEGVAGAMTLQQLSGDLTYVNEIHAAWIQCLRVGRTPVTANEHVSLLLDDGEKFELTVPDMSGEVFLAILEQRQWAQSFQSLLDECAGLLVFLNPATVVEPAWIFELPLSQNSERDSPDEIVEPWSVRTAPTQVQIVELIQLLRSQRATPSILPLAVMVSAWDLLAPEYQEPGEWLTDRMPMLHQYLLSNRDRMPFQLFGISAQGGELPADQLRLLDQTPIERVWIVPGPPDTSSDVAPVDAESRNDITEPIRWLRQAARRS